MHTLQKESKPWINTLNKLETQRSEICKLDPIGFDEVIQHVHVFNATKNVKGLVNLVYAHIPVPLQIEKFTYEQSIATMRDLGILVGSIKKHGAEPLELIPELEYVFFELSNKTNLPPRDTLFHYTIWNPEGKRMRTYTGTNDEIELINSVKTAHNPLIYAIHFLIELNATDVNNLEYAEICNQAKESFKGMIDGMVNAKRNVSPSFFANELRHYFEPIIIHHAEYIGPGAVEMPMFVYDHLLWSSDTADLEYRKFKTTYLPFNLPNIRDIYYNYDNSPSLLSQMCEELKTSQQVSSTMIKNAKALFELCSTMKSFRMPHKKLATDSYNQQKKNNKNKGSGGYSTSILSHILNLNLQQIFRLESAIKMHY